jgi:hypothetical protein
MRPARPASASASDELDIVGESPEAQDEIGARRLSAPSSGSEREPLATLWMHRYSA